MLENRNVTRNRTTSTASKFKASKSVVDGGWGWVVVASSFIICAITSGLSSSVGVFYVEIVEIFGGTSAQVAWISSLMRFIYLLVGPLASAMMTILGARVTIIIGSVAISAGLFISAYATSIYILYMSMGVFTGAGLGMVYQAAKVMVNYYFLKRRGLANGITACGGGVGVFIFPLMINFLWDRYGFQGTCMILAGIALQGVVCGMLVISPTISLQRKGSKYVPRSEPDSECQESPLDSPEALVSDLTYNYRRADLNWSCSLEEPPSPISRVAPYPQSLEPVQEIPSIRESIPAIQRTATSNTHVHIVTRYLKKILKACGDKKLLTNGTFIILVASQGLYRFGLPIVNVFIPARAASFGLTGFQSSFLISMMGVSSLVSRLCCGVLADMKCLAGKSIYLYLGGMMAAGAVTVVNFGETFEEQLTYSIILGLCIGCISCLSCVTMADLLGVRKLTKAYGMRNFISAFASLTGPALSGWIFDTTSSYDIMFACSGVTMFLAGLILLTIPCLNRHREKQLQMKEQREAAAKPTTISPPDYRPLLTQSQFSNIMLDI